MSENQKKKILVADDDELLRDTLCDMIAKAGYEVKAAQDGMEASSVINLESFDLVLSDIRMPNMSGIELLHFIKKNKPMPVVLMTGFAEIAEAQEAYELGARGFLPKPFKKADLIATLDMILGEKEEEAPEDLDERFCPIRIDDFVTGREIRYDIYIRLSKLKYVKIATGGENLNRDQIERYKSKNVHHLHLTKEDFRKYVGFNVDLAKKVAASERLALKKKVDFLMQASMETTKNLFVNDVDQESFGAAQETVLTSLGVVAEAPNIFDMLEALRGHTDNLYAHSLAVSIYATMIAKKVGWNSPRTISKVSMCGLFHDIGKKEIPPEILAKPRMKRSAEETKIYESHVTRGLEIIQLSDELPAEVSQVALQHHENCSGLGYPMRLSKHKIQPIARLIGLANDFCNLIIQNVDQKEPLAPAPALQKLEQTANKYDEEFLKGLRQLIAPVAK